MPEQYLRSFRPVCEERHLQSVEALLQAEGYLFETEAFSPHCRRLLSEPEPLGNSLAAFFGYIYIQDRSSMLPPLALANALMEEKVEAVLDLCASPGSKTSFLAQLFGADCFILANEPNPNRLSTLRTNLQRLNLLSVATCAYHGHNLPLFPNSWPVILLDPPCSGWGTVQKNPRVSKIWQGDKVKKLLTLQRALLRRAASLLCLGGRLLYSTCTTNFEENEGQVLFAERELGLVREPLQPFPGFVWEERPGGEGTLLVNGEQSQAQGFYLALLRKARNVEQTTSFYEQTFLDGQIERKATSPICLKERSFLQGCCVDPDKLPAGQILLCGEQVRFLAEQAQNFLPASFPCRGALLGQKKGTEFRPDAHLRCLFPDQPDPKTSLVLETVADVRKLLTGQSLQSDLVGNVASLWWRDLPLGRVALKNRRAVALFK